MLGWKAGLKGMNGNIDFVITWVDGNDPQWKTEKNKYLSDGTKVDVSSSRYRAMNTFKYLMSDLSTHLSGQVIRVDGGIRS